MYKVVAVLSKAGDQVPLNPLIEVVGKGESRSPEQIGATALKVAATGVLTVIVRVAEVAHCPTAGVKVYKVVAVLSKAGDQVPLNPLLELVGKGERKSPEQIGATALNVGGVAALTVMVKVAEVAH